jgi:branched-chain amino acid transport system permease protein
LSFDIVTSSFKERERLRSPWARAVLIGLIFGVISAYFALVGIYGTFHQRWILIGVLTLGQALLLGTPFAAGIEIARRTGGDGLEPPMRAFVGGLVAGIIPALLILVITVANVRGMFIALSPQLFRMLTFGLGGGTGAAVLIGASVATAVAGSLLASSSRLLRRPVSYGLALVGLVGLFQELLQLVLRAAGHSFDLVTATLFDYDGLLPGGAAIVFVCTALLVGLWEAFGDAARSWHSGLAPRAARGFKTAMLTLALLAVFFFPALGGPFVAQVFLLVGLYALMGMGLNVEVGLAGLLDLGFVAFFAIGAYTIALLTADSPQALAHLSFWAALPIAVLASVLFGVLFGVPVLGVRGDYLAVATLGIGEIVRLIVLSDMARPLLGGAQGILNIPSPTIGSVRLADPLKLYFLTVIAVAVASYFAWRVQNSRLGRTWTALRDDEDAAQALGINLVQTKLLAYGIGAAFAGLAGAIFAVMLTSIFPHSFELLISINVLALIIVGGIGSLPGTIVGALVLIGLPEILRDFGEYRFLFYGAVIVAMMQIKPEGLWPARARRRERAAHG